MTIKDKIAAFHAAMHYIANGSSGANIVTSPEEKVQARVAKYAKRKKPKSKRRPKFQSVRTVSGGLPSLGKRK